jgi:hypothetical protein
MSEVVQAVCPSCGAPQARRFCEECGEKRIATHDYSLVHFAGHLLETLTHFDYRSLRALWALVAKPGLLTRDYLDGRRKRHVGPIQLFVIVNVITALVGFNTFRTPLFIQEHDPPFVQLKRGMVTTAIEHSGMSREEFTKAFDRNASTQGKTWVFSMIPVFALVLMLLYGFRRYYFEHLVLATHFYAFMLIWLLVGGMSTILALRLSGITLSGPAMQDVVTVPILAGFAGYLFFALRRTFGGGVFAAAVRAVVLAGLFFPIVQLYRVLLFFVTLKTMH